MRKTIFAVTVAMLAYATASASWGTESEAGGALPLPTDTSAANLTWESDVTVVESDDARSIVILGAEPSDTQAVITFGSGMTPVDTLARAAAPPLAPTEAAVVSDGGFVIITSPPQEGATGAEGIALRPTPRFNLLSARSEYQLVFGEIGTVGLRLEFGMIDDERGIYLTGDLGGGANYYGIGLNVGYRVSNDAARYAFGLSCGYHNTELVAIFRAESNSFLSRRVGRNTALAGVFAKVMPWEAGNLDISTRVMFGYREDSAWYDGVREEIYVKDGFSAVWSISLGYTVLKRSAH